jgi:hypothetical protein
MRLGSNSSRCWSSDTGRVVLLEAGRATLELLADAQAATVGRIEARQRVSGAVRLALEVSDSDRATARRGWRWARRPAGDHALGGIGTPGSQRLDFAKLNGISTLASGSGGSFGFGTGWRREG